ncbi:Protein of unknown function [Lactobacillus delbrueckii subsp. bulgaricus]|nr:Protein of unknown function [Lactobacillus delbrueckii subsp. bulgaricus]
MGNTLYNVAEWCSHVVISPEALRL